MGSCSSKHNAAESSEAAEAGGKAAVLRSRSKGSRMFHCSCLGALSGSHDSDNGDPQKHENSNEGPCAKHMISDLDQDKAECPRKAEIEQGDEMTCSTSNAELDDWVQSANSSLSDAVPRGGNTSTQAFASRSLNLSSRFLSGFSFFPGNMSFSLCRAASLGSSRAYPASSTGLMISQDEQERQLHTGSSGCLFSRNAGPQGCDFLPGCLSSRSLQSQFAPGNHQSNDPSSGFSDNLSNDQMTSTQDADRDAYNSVSATFGFNLDFHSPGNHTEIDGCEMRLAVRHIRAREPMEQNVRFSRTLSVGRLRDRVLRRSSFADLTFCPLQHEREARDALQRSSFADLTFCPLQQEREERDATQGSGRQPFGGGPVVMASDETALMSPAPSTASRSLYRNQHYEMGSSRAREARYHDLLEHRSNVLERRRRIRSQVLALRHLGSRFENLSGHERSCISSGQHRTGHCTCRLSTRDASSTDDSSASASISRIVILAEALFEVLDEIHQQSVVLSSRSSVSSIGSVPAPNEIVESLPVKLFTNLQKLINEEAAQCYICLVDYEEGDILRILPCHHEFHRACVDKWLKEIHRVCPLCRGDICRSDSLPTDN